MKRWNGLALTLCAGLFCACSAPPYQPVSPGRTARIHFVNFDSPQICVSGERFSLTPDANGNASVPAAGTVHLLGSYRRGSGQCSPAVKFAPQAGQTYEVVNDVRAEKCMVNVMRHDAGSQYGLRVEPSANAPQICR